MEEIEHGWMIVAEILAGSQQSPESSTTRQRIQIAVQTNNQLFVQVYIL